MSEYSNKSSILENDNHVLSGCTGGEAVSREDVMEAIERAKFGINDRRLTPTSIGKGLSKLFPWMPTLVGTEGTREDGSQGFMGYQTLS